ncbi:MAG: arsenate reductase ArsC [Dehalococcoidia bacterium]|nr:arsenate reductase ArsC [Dehalococcoidia bacterium]
MTNATDPVEEARSPGVLFLCIHNAGRSQMAAGWTRTLGGPAVRVYSAGSEPASALNARAVEVMREAGIELGTERPKRWTEEMLEAVDVVVTMGCGDSCPFVPGVRYVDWELDDPAGLDLDGVRRVRDEIEARVRALLTELGVPADTQRVS